MELSNKINKPKLSRLTFINATLAILVISVAGYNDKKIISASQAETLSSQAIDTNINTQKTVLSDNIINIQGTKLNVFGQKMFLHIPDMGNYNQNTIVHTVSEISKEFTNVEKQITLVISIKDFMGKNGSYNSFIKETMKDMANRGETNLEYLIRKSSNGHSFTTSQIKHTIASTQQKIIVNVIVTDKEGKLIQINIVSPADLTNEQKEYVKEIVQSFTCI